MKLLYQKEVSQVLEYLYAIRLMKVDVDKRFPDLSQRQKESLQDVATFHAQLREECEPLLPKIKEVNFSEPVGITYPIALYFYLFKNGEQPANIKAFLDRLRQLSKEELLEALSWMLTDSSEKVENLLGLLEEMEFSAEDKWYAYQAILHPEKTRDKMIFVLSAFAELYQPVYQSFHDELAAFETEVNEDTIRDLFKQHEGIVNDETDYHLILLSPFITRVESIILADDEEPSRHSPQHIVVLSCRMPEMLAKSKDLDVEDTAKILKTMGDATRYQVLQELTKPHMKKKDIAEKLGITSAAVTFHTQKLINAQILTVQSESDDLKYVVNQELLQELTDKLLADFANK